MLKHFFLLLVATFSMGVMSGVFVYFTTQDSTPSILNFGGNNVARGFEIIADSYGGCLKLGCISYHIADDGTYTVIRSHRGSTDERGEGTISATDFAKLKSILKKEDFSAVTNSTSAETCTADSDGIAYQYEIRIGETMYRFNSCKQNLARNELFTLLEGYFGTFAQKL
ncbi:hypothetical protein GW943_01895 [Candidatus Parcubacteria bacterium]|uniref:Uncharacterized protein n=1 Tax=Candidatus Kaiserbacteria bacterium CG10_big_fil_rev_8_21_14_0_10_47_16 TaxID=1974608 RepID=A0A2H0UED9_9BACT|nr:hypothetical protein [Candidatus Parcubacteria bacterium]PIR84783.1 MAG: hypothetical protein COU16_01185 [Candidatus Kaiserbacteria bacterium CG10_big_fil_rev_8_21_14_0_10_47_16]